MTYSQTTDGFNACPRCGADVAVGASFCPVCGASQIVPVAAARRRGTPWWVPAGIIAGGIAAIGAGVLLAAILDGGPDSVAGDPSPTATSSSAATSLVEPSSTAELSPSPSPTPEPAAVIPNLGIAAVVTDALNLRSQPNDGASVVAELAPGRRVFVIGAPTETDDLRWYRVATVQSRDCVEACGDFIGYLATPLAADEPPWVEGVAIDCPISPMTHEELATLLPLEALHCYGRNEIVVTGTVADPIGGYEGPFEYSPAWLAHPLALPFLATADGHVLGFRPHPDGDPNPPEEGDVLRVTGHFEDPAATSCRVTVDPAFADSDPPPVPPDPALTILTCRATFAWTDFEVIGP